MEDTFFTCQCPPAQINPLIQSNMTADTEYNYPYTPYAKGSHIKTNPRQCTPAIRIG